MLKISEGKRAKQTVMLRLEGRVVGPWVSELRQICDPLVSDGSKLALDLAEVSFADDSGIALLASLRSHGVKLLNATPFVAEQLKAAATTTTSSH
ncbi:MAG: STAS domain-containing protein [Verrucomicrobia bacterium]|nr:MAG: STAS domain-containing protein [Verrucomicrobiota bacterium]